MSLVDAVRRALSNCERGEPADPAGRWRVLALIAARKDSDPAARPWRSSRYLPSSALVRDAFPDCGLEMGSDTDTRPNGRGNAGAKADLLRYEEAIADHDRAIGLERGNAAA